MEQKTNSLEAGRDRIQVIASVTLQDALRALLGLEHDTSTLQFAHVIPAPNPR